MIYDQIKNLSSYRQILPGIAAVILSIGMAVDANVIIFSRIKEEIAKGDIKIEKKTKKGAIKEINVWATFTELEDGRIIIELRSCGKNVNQIAVKYGGGGHLQASGATISGYEELELVIEDLIALAKE